MGFKRVDSELRQNACSDRDAVKQCRQLLGVTPVGDINRTSERTCGVQRSVNFDDHAVGDDALIDQLFSTFRAHFRNTLTFAVEDTADV